MNIELIVYGTETPCRRHLTVPTGTTVDRLCTLVNVSRSDFTIVVNGVHAGGGHILKPGDRVAMFPPLAGGQSLTMSIRIPTPSRNASR